VLGSDMGVPGGDRAFLLNAEQHRRLAALLRRGTAPGHDEQAAHHERLAEALEQRDRDIAKLRAIAVSQGQQ
jgi:hypothetical protein